MKGKFYILDYIPNKIVFIKDSDKSNFYAFFKERGTKIRAIKHGISKGMKGDFKPYKPGVAIRKELFALITNAN